jgi:hypothetical protein
VGRSKTHAVLQAEMTTRHGAPRALPTLAAPAFHRDAIQARLAVHAWRFAMSAALPAGIPPLEETGYTRDSLIDALRNERELPSTEIAFATLYADAIEPDVIALLERAQGQDLDIASRRLLFRGIHILGGRRVGAAYRPLVAFLRGSQDRVDELLGDAVTENLSQILAGVFDGDPQPLCDLVIDAGVDGFVREAALKALAFLAFEARIDRRAFEAFLLRFDEARLAPADDDVMWHAWMTAVAALGVATLEPRVRSAFADGRISPDWCDEDDFDELLQAAIARPNDRTRLEPEQMGYIEDTVVALENFSESDDDFAAGPFADDEDDSEDAIWPSRVEPGIPAENPYRDVGRNDPCPCGSGKKFKKCCLQQ